MVDTGFTKLIASTKPYIPGAQRIITVYGLLPLLHPWSSKQLKFRHGERVPRENRKQDLMTH